MLFNSLAFFLFLPVALAVFGLLPERQRWAWLLLASFFFYAFGGPTNLAFLGAITLVAYGCGWGLGRSDSRTVRIPLLAGGLVAILGSLAAFKFYDFLAGELEGLTGAGFPRLGIATPVGYSFYAFMAASYLIDVFRREIEPERHLGRAALYLAYFPKILAGPIERAKNFLPQVQERLRAEPETFVLGLQLIAWGLVKKVVIADNLAPLVDRVFGIAAYATPMELLISVYFFAFQIYCDFSGYTDVAIGVSLLFGIRLMENFRRPYLSVSTAEFWAERWHISLGRWFRDYLYFPLGGSRVGTLRRYANLMIVFLVSGLWHAGLGYGVGWTFLVWGALNGLYQWGGLATRPLWAMAGSRMPGLAGSGLIRVLRIFFTFHLILISWVFFRAENIDQALMVLKRIGSALPSIPGLIGNYPFTAEHYLGFTLVLSLLVIEILDERRAIWERLKAMPVALRWGTYYAGIFALLMVGRWQAGEFIYMQF